MINTTVWTRTTDALFLLILMFIFSATCRASQNASTNFDVQFTLVQPTCTVTDTGAIDMGKHTVKEFTGPGMMSTPVLFTLNISNCDGAGVKTRILFHGNADNSSKNYFQLEQGAGKSTGLALRLADENGKIIIPEGMTEYFASPGNATISLNLTAAFIQTAPVTVGDATTTLTYELVYD